MTAARWIGTVFGIGFFLSGALAAAICLFAWTTAGDAASWPTVAGAVTRTSVNVERRVARVRAGRPDSVVYSYTPEVEYQYVVGDRTFTARAITFGFQEIFRTRGEAQRFLDERYRRGAPVLVHYDPADPGDACRSRRPGC